MVNPTRPYGILLGLSSASQINAIMIIRITIVISKFSRTCIKEIAKMTQHSDGTSMPLGED